jgi:DNA invertase Pin-like site-specific DNA recombinase
MTSRNEPAGVWVRVSTADQSEASQVPDVERHCQDRGYRIERRYELNDKSASKGEQQAALDEMLIDMRDGTIRVLVCWHSDRIERRGVEAMFRLIRQIKDAGGRLESTKEPLLGTEDLSGEATTALNAVIAHQESVKKSDRQKISVSALKTRGSVYNNVPWGFDIVGDKYAKRIVPTEACRAIVPEIFARCINGDSLRTIAAWLDSEGIPTPRGNAHWNESTVRWTIRQRAYAGRLQTREGETIARCEAVISADIFDRANQALKTRPKRGAVNANRPMLAKLRCARCGSPMYRLFAGKPGKKRHYYRCSGSGPQRKGCGNMVRLEPAETVVAVRIFMTSTEPHQIRHWVEGTNWNADIADVKQDMREAIDAERFSELASLQAKLEDYRGRDTVPGHYELTDTGMTVGDYFDSLDNEGKREYLKTRDIRIEKAMPNDPGATRGIRVVIDGEDHGVFPYPPELTV